MNTNDNGTNSSDLDQQGNNSQDSGNNTIDWETVDVADVPDSVIARLSSQQLKGNEYYSQALEESVTRRQELQRIKDEQKKNDGKNAKNTNESGDSSEVVALREQVSNLEGLLKQTIDTWTQTQTDSHIKSLQAKYNLSDDHLEFLTATTATDLEAQAKKLSALQGNNFDDETGNSIFGTDNRDALKERIKNRLLGTEQSNGAFDIGLQKRVGGRAIIS